MREQRNKISFRGQKIYVGIDVHLKSWSVTVLSETSVLKKFSQHPSPEALYGFLTRSYPGAEYHSVYEAGFCGFWIHERLTALGIDNIVVNPADVPTKSSEKLRKTDTVDSGKLARSLRANELKGIYTPDSVSLEMRSLIRLKNSITKDTTRQKNRLKSQLRYLGIEIPQEFLTPFSNWSKRFFAWLKEIETGHTTASFAMVGVALMRCKVITFMPILMLAMLIAFSRIYLRVHYLTDVIAGMILGLTCGICSVLIFNTVVPMWFPMV